MAALEGYLTDTASALFALAARIAGSPTAEVEHVARHAGLAQGFTDVIAALPRDASRRQLFVPQQLLESRGGNMEEVFSGKATPRIRAALDQLIAEARQHLETSFALLSDVPRDIAPIFLPLAVVRRESERMSRPDIDPFKPLCPLEAVNPVDVVAGVEVSGLQRPVAPQRFQSIFGCALSGSEAVWESCCVWTKRRRLCGVVQQVAGRLAQRARPSVTATICARLQR